MAFNLPSSVSRQLLLLLLLVLFIGLSAHAIPGCPVNFEFLNYTIITSKCKGPRYPPSICCGAFKEFACPYADVLNDLTNDCASTMFSYINLYGKYPPGLFSSECREGKEGLACPAAAPSTSADDTASQIVHYPSMIMVLSAGFLILLFQ
ncbi:GPI-anchored protein LLG1 [Senna tora]|uniref:GPI-anchored protein LLG1 n=1 Tax=Senna tora TaxID=362788 RepID=A0A834TZX5_9FABA|nr:GPI-anchored protein LLG1 [Senna tora]